MYDVLGFILNKYSLNHTAYFLDISGCVSAVVAAIFGLIDLINTVPPASSAKKRGIKHGLLNTTVLIIFIIVAVYRNTPHSLLLVVMALELIGVILLSIAGFMGGTLVYRNQIGVDLRYANAGKWKEITVDKDSGEVEVAQEDELKTDQMKLIRLKDKRLVLGRTEQGYVVFDDHCTHRGGSLAGGAMICGTVQCPWHGSQFDVNTGEVKAGPAKEKINTYPLNVREGKVYIRL
jgi:nitrite reductase/ring-hydroxylating ferredoxin subunit/uncharacterized membrane protein